jgi:hypothetical protein
MIILECFHMRFELLMFAKFNYIYESETLTLSPLNREQHMRDSVIW